MPGSCGQAPGHRANGIDCLVGLGWWLRTVELRETPSFAGSTVCRMYSRIIVLSGEKGVLVTRN